MLGLPRFALKSTRILTLTCALVVPAVGLPSYLHAQEAQPTSAPTPVPKELQNAVENYWFYGKVARYELSVAEGQKIVSSEADPETILRAFENVSQIRGDNIDEWLIRFQRIEPMKAVTEQVINKVAEGYRARRASPEFIRQQIERLLSGPRGYENAMPRLRESGEIAVPFLIDILRDPTRRNTLPTIRRALRDLGQIGLNPLVASTEMQDWDTLTTVVGILGELGYQGSAPYLARLLDLPDAPPPVKAVASEALTRLGVAPGSSAGKASDLFYDLGEKFYYENASVVSDKRWPMSNVWYWGQNGLERKQVPHQIWGDIMAMRACEYTLKLGGAKSDDALGLWLAANFKREADLPEGQTDATRPENYPSGHYWGVSGGAKYLEAALARAIKNKNSAVAFRAIRSLQEIVGQSNLAANAANPLVWATQFPDRKVRFEAAFALAAAMPASTYEGAQRVVPLLAEALAQTGQPSVMVIASSQDEANKLVDGLKGVGFAVAGATSAESAASNAVALPAVDVLLVSEDLGQGNVDQLFVMASQNPKLAGAARLVMTKTTASPFETRKVSDPLLSTTTAADAEGLKGAIEAARVKSGALPLDPTVATDYATRAGKLLIDVGTARPSVYPLAPAKTTLLGALGDPRPEIIMLSGKVLGLVNDKEAQGALLAGAQEEKNADEVKISLYRSLASNARNFGNMLNGDQVSALEKAVAETANLDVRSAAAEARGALNLPADQAKKLVVDQSKV
jgi:hypothetical protein